MSIKDTYKVGDILCDMHDGFSYLPKNLIVLEHRKLRTDDALKMLQEFCEPLSIKTPTNKYLVIVSDMTNGKYKAMYSYDDRIFGVVEIEIKTKPCLKRW
jgi:hypothetical protein